MLENYVGISHHLKRTDACKVPELLFQHIYIEEHISGIQESEFQEGKKIGNLMAGYF